MAITLGTQNIYNGSPQPVVISKVKTGSATLLENGTDYTITSGGTATNVESTQLIITGMGNYTGTKSAYWTLRKATPTVSDFTGLGNKSFTYTGSGITVPGPVPVAGKGLGQNCTIYYEGKG